MKVIQITSSTPVRYSVNGRGLTEFDPGNLYEVPDHVADGMVRRNWGKIMTSEELKAMGAEPGKQGLDPAAPGYDPALDKNRADYDPAKDPTSADYVAPDGTETPSDEDGDGDKDAEDPDSTKAQGTTSPAPAPLRKKPGPKPKT